MNDTNNLIAVCVIGVGLAVLLSQLNSHNDKPAAAASQQQQPQQQPIIVEQCQVVEKKVIVKHKRNKPKQGRSQNTEIWDPWYFGFRRRKNENMG